MRFEDVYVGQISCYDSEDYFHMSVCTGKEEEKTYQTFFVYAKSEKEFRKYTESSNLYEFSDKRFVWMKMEKADEDDLKYVFKKIFLASKVVTIKFN